MKHKDKQIFFGNIAFTSFYERTHPHFLKISKQTSYKWTSPNFYPIPYNSFISFFVFDF